MELFTIRSYINFLTKLIYINQCLFFFFCIVNTSMLIHIAGGVNVLGLVYPSSPNPGKLVGTTLEVSPTLV